MEQGLVPLNSPTAITSISTTMSVSTNDSTTDQQQTTDENLSTTAALPSDDMMDLLRAIEMSRLQAIRENEQNIYRPNANPQSTILSTSDKMDYFNDLQQAIELSLKTKSEQHTKIETTSSFGQSSRVLILFKSIDSRYDGYSRR